MGTHFELFIKKKENGMLIWVAIWNKKHISEHEDCIKAIINTGYCDNRQTAFLMAKNCGLIFDGK